MNGITKCDSCLNSRIVVSENGMKSVCCLPKKQAVSCIIGEKDSYKGFPPKMKGTE